MEDIKHNIYGEEHDYINSQKSVEEIHRCESSTVGISIPRLSKTEK